MDKYVELAKKTIETFITHGDVYEPSEDEMTEEMKDHRAGAFVSIHENGQLRGCIGTISPTCKNIAYEIVSNAIAASTRDPRFDPIRSEELDNLEINVDVLSPEEPIDSPDQLDVNRYGVIVEKGLPDLDGVDTVEEQIAIAKRKAGIDPDAKGVKLYRFEVVRHV